MPAVLKYYLAYLLLLGLITFLFYAADKRRAKRGAWRVPEKTLLLLSFAGGAFGGFLAMRLCHHKTRHWYFNVVNILGILLHTALAIAVWRLL